MAADAAPAGSCPRGLAGHRATTACVKTRSGGLPQLDPVALGIGDPAEAADTLHVLRLLSYVRSLSAQLREHRIQVTDPEVEHGLLGAGPEVTGLGLERREHRRPGGLAPQAVLVGVQAQAIAVPRAQGRRVGGPHEVPADSKYTLHAAILPGRRPGQADFTAASRRLSRAELASRSARTYALILVSAGQRGPTDRRTPRHRRHATAAHAGSPARHSRGPRHRKLAPWRQSRTPQGRRASRTAPAGWTHPGWARRLVCAQAYTDPPTPSRRGPPAGHDARHRRSPGSAGYRQGAL